MKPNTIAAIYARVSTLEQSENGNSIEAQLALSQDYCRKHNKTYKVYVDRGVSGSSRQKRKGLAQLLRDAEAGHFQEVIVWKLSRMARNSLDLLEIIEIFDKYGIRFYSLSESFDNSAIGKFQLQTLANVAQFELVTIRDNVRAGRMQRAKNGKWCGGLVFGYESVPVSEGTDETYLKVVPKEAKIVQEIFELYAFGKGYKAIVNVLNRSGVRTKTGKRFSLNTIRTILRNPIYIGKIRYYDWREKMYRTVQGEHEPILSESIWQKAQNRLESNTTTNRVPERFYPLTHLLRCPECGAGMIGWHHNYVQTNGKVKRYDYYICGRFHNNGSAACSANAVKALDAEQTAILQIKNLINEPNMLKDIVSRVNGRYQQTEQMAKGRLKAMEEKIKKQKARQKRVFIQFEEDQITKKVFTEKIQSLKAEEENLMKKREAIATEVTENQKPKISYTQIKTALRSLEHLLDCTSDDKKRRLLYTMIDHITINRQRDPNSLCIHFQPQFLPIPVLPTLNERSMP